MKHVGGLQAGNPWFRLQAVSHSGSDRSLPVTCTEDKDGIGYLCCLPADCKPQRGEVLVSLIGAISTSPTDRPARAWRCRCRVVSTLHCLQVLNNTLQTCQNLIQWSVLKKETRKEKKRTWDEESWKENEQKKASKRIIRFWEDRKETGGLKLSEYRNKPSWKGRKRERKGEKKQIQNKKKRSESEILMTEISHNYFSHRSPL